MVPVVYKRRHVAPQDHSEAQHSIRVACAYLPVLEAADHSEPEASPRNSEPQLLSDLLILLLVFEVKHLRSHLYHDLEHLHPLVKLLSFFSVSFVFFLCHLASAEKASVCLLRTDLAQWLLEAVIVWVERRLAAAVFGH